MLVKDNIDINSVDFSNKVRRLLSDGRWRPRSFDLMLSAFKDTGTAAPPSKIEELLNMGDSLLVRLDCMF